MIGAFFNNNLLFLKRCLILSAVIFFYYLADLGLNYFEHLYSKPITLTFNFPIPETTAKTYKVSRTPDIDKILVSGFFSDWAEDSPYELHPIAPGKWSIDIVLPPGANQYKFVIYPKGSNAPVWVYDITNPELVLDTWGEYNSIVYIPDFPFYRQVAHTIFNGLIILFVVGFFIEPIIHRILHWRLPFRYKLIISMISIVVASNCIFMFYNLRESRELVKEGIIDNVNFVHLVLSGRKIDFMHLPEQRDQLRDALADFFWHSKTRVERSQASPYQITLSDLALLDTNYNLIYLSHRNQNEALQTKRATKLGYRDSTQFFMHGIFAQAIAISKQQTRLSNIVFGLPNPEVLAAEPFETRQGNFLLGYSAFVKPIFIQGKLVGFYAGAIQSKLYGAEIARVLYSSLTIIIIISGVSIFLLTSVGRLVTRYLNELEQWTQQIVKGDFSSRVHIESGDEIQALAENFDTMRSSLEESFIEIENKNELLLHEAYFDSLTGLPNRKKMLLDLLENPSQGLIIINIDSFRGLNDFFGNDVGDIILKQVTQRLQMLSEEQNHRVYKIGADEFAIAITDADYPLDLHSTEKIELFTHKICEAITNTCYLINENEIYISVTAGIAFDEHKVPNKVLFNRAANAMRIAKERLVGQLVYEASMEEAHAFEHNMTWANKVKSAIDEGRIVPYFQPIVCNANQNIEKYECLVRLIEKDNSVISPFAFLTIAKQARLYPFITQMMIDKSFTQFANINVSFSINLSIDDIIDPTTHQYIISTMTQYPTTAARVIFEIIESSEIHNYEVLRHFINEIKALGGRIAIDDFGSGYSNFAHIMSMNIDYLKIDGSLIRHLDTDTSAQIITQTIAAFAKKLGIKTIAEFVHSQIIYDKVVEYGIDMSQGYYFGKPLPELVNTDFNSLLFKDAL